MKNYNIQSIDFEKGKGLIPVIVQESESKTILMLAYANRKAIEKTLETGHAHYWSRSRNSLWMKGESSKNIQKIKKILIDCDLDTLLYVVEQKGNACHTGKFTCFHNQLKDQ